MNHSNYTVSAGSDIQIGSQVYLLYEIPTTFLARNFNSTKFEKINIHVHELNGCIVGPGLYQEWATYVRAARYPNEQNLELCRNTSNNMLLYRAIKQIRKGDELLAWYSPNVLQELCRHIASPNDYLALNDLLLSVNNETSCKCCSINFEHTNVLKSHLLFDVCAKTLLLARTFQLNNTRNINVNNEFNKQLTTTTTTTTHNPSSLIKLEPLIFKTGNNNNNDSSNNQNNSLSSIENSAFSPIDKSLNKSNSKTSQKTNTQHKLRSSNSSYSSCSSLTAHTTNNNDNNHNKKHTKSDKVEFKNKKIKVETSTIIPPIMSNNNFGLNITPSMSQAFNFSNTSNFKLRKNHQTIEESNKKVLASTPNTSMASSEIPNNPQSINPKNIDWKITILDGTQTVELNVADELGKPKKTHVCLFCGKIYHRKYGLKIHLRTHTGYKPLKCKVCSRPFSDPSNLNKHVRLHSQGETPYSCPYCNKILVRKRDLDRHIISRHTNNSTINAQENEDENNQSESMSMPSESNDKIIDICSNIDSS